MHGTVCTTTPGEELGVAHDVPEERLINGKASEPCISLIGTVETGKRTEFRRDGDLGR